MPKPRAAGRSGDRVLQVGRWPLRFPARGRINQDDSGGAERTGWCFQAAGVGDVGGSRHRVSLQNGSFADGLRVTACPAQDDKLVEFSFVRLSVRLSSSEPSAVILNQRNGSGAPVKDLFCCSTVSLIVEDSFFT